MTKRKLLSREDLLNSSKLKVVKVETEEGDIYVRELSGKGMLEYNEKLEALKKDNPELTPSASLEMAALLVSMTACDEQGNLLFTKEDVPALLRNSITLLMKLAEEAMKASGISQAAIDEAKNELKKARPASSTTASPTS